jgi:hypothetical protein
MSAGRQVHAASIGAKMMKLQAVACAERIDFGRIEEQ